MSQYEEYNSTITESTTESSYFTNNSNEFLTDLSPVTHNLLKDIESISNRMEHIKINSTLACFVEYLNSEFSLLQEDIKDPIVVKTKERPSGTKCKKTGAEHAIKK
ncbi:7300_t:CDS:2, partial [Racocetra fulgida]